MRDLNVSTYYVYCGLLKWDTSSLGAGATVTSAVLKMYPTFKVNQGSLSLRGEYYAWDGSSASDHTADSTSGTTAFNAVTLSSITTSANNDFTLVNLSNVNKTGETKIRLHITGTTPTNLNELSIASFDHSTLQEPRLEVTYTLSGGDLIGMVGI
jgi:hypothetical protein